MTDTPIPAHTAAVFEESHGRSIGYQRGCRCERCVGWRRDYDRRRYRRLHPDRDISEAEVRRRWPHVAAAIEAAAVARHVRETGCEGLRDAAQALDLFYQHEYLTYCDEPPFGPYPIAVSIEHDRRLGDLMEALRAALASPATEEACAREGCGHTRGLHDVGMAYPDGPCFATVACPCTEYQPATASAAATSEEGGE